MKAPQIEAAMRDLLGLQNIAAAGTVLAQRVLDAYGTGLDFADALHAAQCPDGDQFATFLTNPWHAMHARQACTGLFC